MQDNLQAIPSINHLAVGGRLTLRLNFSTYFVRLLLITHWRWQLIKGVPAMWTHDRIAQLFLISSERGPRWVVSTLSLVQAGVSEP